MTPLQPPKFHDPMSASLWSAQTAVVAVESHDCSTFSGYIRQL